MVQVSLPNGCIGYPDEREQWLCWQHYDKLNRDKVDHEIMVDYRLDE